MRLGTIIRHRAFGAFAVFALVTTVAVAAFLPVRFDSREESFEIPKGTWARRMAGDPVDILPSQIFLTLGVRDVLQLRNLDDVPQIFGPTLLMPGQSFRLPFHVASENLFACTAHASGQLTVVVEETPATPAHRLSWRVRRVVRSLSSTFRSHQTKKADG